MKKLIALLAISGAAYTAALAQHETSCAYTVLSGTQTSDLTLNAGTRYELRGCYTIASGAKLQIPAGTVIFAGKSSGAGLYVAPGGQIDARGTSVNPIIFTSDQDPAYRAPGDWDGIVIAGNATNNVGSGEIPVTRTCTIAASAKNNDADNSGTLRYVQIHYAKSGLILASAGSGTTVDHIQVTHAARNSFEMLGGTAGVAYAVSLNPKQNDFYISYGYRGEMQFLLGWRADAGANDAAGSNGLYITNDPAGSANAPVTRPVISNMTLIGPGFCNAGTLSPNFRDAVRYDLNAQGAVYNSVLADWRLTGLNLASTGSVQATASDDVQFSYNSFHGNAGGDYTSVAWTSPCLSSMAAWISGGISCAENGNQFSSPSYTLGYNAAVCSAATPDFRLGTSGLDMPDYSESDLGSAFFNTTFTARGAFDGSTNWIAGWTSFDPQTLNYCPQQARAATSGGDAPHGIVLAPNPASGTTTVQFDAAETGPALVAVLDNTTGRPLRTVSAELTAAGPQRIVLDVSGLRAGSYVVRVEATGQAPAYGQLVIR